MKTLNKINLFSVFFSTLFTNCNPDTFRPINYSDLRSYFVDNCNKASYEQKLTYLTPESIKQLSTISEEWSQKVEEQKSPIKRFFIPAELTPPKNCNGNFSLKLYTEQRGAQIFNESCTAYQSLYPLFANNPNHLPDKISEITDDCIRDLRLFTGDKTSSTETLSNRLNDCTTIFGKIKFEFLLANPTFDIPELRKRQEAIRFLVSNPDVLKNLEHRLETIREHELAYTYFLSLQPNQDTFSLLNEYYKFYWNLEDAPYKYLTHIPEESVKKEIIKDFKTLNLQEKVMMLSYPLALSLALDQSIGMLLSQKDECGNLKSTYNNVCHKNPNSFAATNMFKTLLKCSFVRFGKKWSEWFLWLAGNLQHNGSGQPMLTESFKTLLFDGGGKLNLTKIARSGAAGAAMIPATMVLINYLTMPFNLIIKILFSNLDYVDKNIYQKLILNSPYAFKKCHQKVEDFGSLLKASQELSSICMELESEKLAANLRFVPTSQANNQPSKANVKKLEALWNSLEAKCFTEKNKQHSKEWWKHLGSILKTYRLIFELKSEFGYFFDQVGTLDAYCSIARKIIKQQDQNNKFCFVDFIVGTNTPQVELKDMWHPFIREKSKPVNNDFLLGGHNNKEKNMVLTGPNKGGKSTFMRGVMTAVLMAQTFGVCAASQAKISPFAYLNAFDKDPESLAEGESSYSAQIRKLNEIIEKMTEAKSKNQFSLFLGDEALKGTNNIDASAAGIGIAEYISNNLPNAMCIFSTHTTHMNEASKFAEGFANYQVVIQRDLNGDPIWTHKVAPGISQESTAIDVLEESGAEQELINDVKRHRTRIVREFQADKI